MTFNTYKVKGTSYLLSSSKYYFAVRQTFFESQTILRNAHWLQNNLKNYKVRYPASSTLGPKSQSFLPHDEPLSSDRSFWERYTKWPQEITENTKGQKCHKNVLLLSRVPNWRHFAPWSAVFKVQANLRRKRIAFWRFIFGKFESVPYDHQMILKHCRSAILHVHMWLSREAEFYSFLLYVLLFLRYLQVFYFPNLPSCYRSLF